MLNFHQCDLYKWSRGKDLTFLKLETIILETIIFSLFLESFVTRLDLTTKV